MKSLTNIVHYSADGTRINSYSPSPFASVVSEYILMYLGDMTDFHYDNKTKYFIINWKDKTLTYVSPKSIKQTKKTK